MMRLVTIAKRESLAVMLSPIWYLLVALFLFINGLVFWDLTLQQGQPASMRTNFELIMWLLLLIAPAVAMRTIAEEDRTGMFEVLMTSPLTESQVVIGKFVGAMVVIGLFLAGTAALAIPLLLYGRADYGEILCGYLGLLLAASVYVSSGMLASAVFSNQGAAFIMTALFWFLLNAASALIPALLPSWTDVASAAAPNRRLADFTIGLVDSSNVIYFLAITALFLIAAIKSLQLTRCR